MIVILYYSCVPLYQCRYARDQMAKHGHDDNATKKHEHELDHEHSYEHELIEHGYELEQIEHKREFSELSDFSDLICNKTERKICCKKDKETGEKLFTFQR